MYTKFTLYLVLLVLLLAAPVWAATYTVTNTLDAGAGSLRWAITQANAGAFDTINFNIGGGGFWSIAPLSPLPPLTDPAGTMVDGLSQPGALPGGNPPSTAQLQIEITGIFAGPAHGLWIMSDNNIVQGLIVNDFEQDGFRIEGGLANPTADNNLLYCNFVGTDVSGGIDLGNGRNMQFLWAGIHICNVPNGQAIFNTVDRCLSSGNWAEGVWIEGPKQPGIVGFNNVMFSYIGTDAMGIAPLGNDHEGVCLSEGTNDNMVDSCLISANQYDGVGIQGYNNFGYGPPIISFNNIVVNNIIGLDINLNPLGNAMHGVAIGEYGPGQWGCAIKNQVLLNFIAHNGTDGVAVYEDWIDNFNADENMISQNYIYANGGLGIDLQNDGVTLNDYPNDPDTWLGNQGLNFPVITGVNYNLGITTVSGSLDIDTAENTATVEVFYAAGDPSGYGEGSLFVGSAIPNAAGNWSMNTGLLVPGDLVTATTTDAMTNTSEFCLNARVSGTPSLTTSTRILSASRGTTVNFALNAGVANAGRNYLVLGSTSGTVPGFLLPMGLATMPLNWDWFTDFVMTYLNTPIFLNFLSVLDATGGGWAQMNLGVLPPYAAGVVLDFAFCCNSPFNYVSNPAPVLIIP